MSDGSASILRRDQPRVRAKAPKKRTGCITCKLRHMRCDEGRPVCQRCIKSQRICRGYIDINATHASQASQPAVVKKLLPRLVSSGPPSEPPRIPRTPTVVVHVKQPRDYRYFRSFQEDLAFELAAGFESSLWSQLVLQAADSEPIFQLTVATSALRLSSQTVWPCELDGMASHREYALNQYGVALKGVQNSLSKGQDSLRIALISSLLIFCFESLLGDTERAVRNVQSALDVIHEHLEKKKKVSSNFRAHYPSISIEDEILRAFMRLDRPAVALVGRLNNQPAPIRKRMFGSTFHDLSYTIPSSFASITEARKYLEHIRYRMIPKDTQDPGLRTSSTTTQDKPEPVVHLLKSFAHKAIFSHTDELLSQLVDWHQAFTCLSAFSKTEAGEAIFVPAEILYIQAVSFKVMLQGFHSPPQSNFQLRERTPSSLAHPSFAAATQILTLSRSLVRHPGFKKTFTFDAGIIPCLWIIVLTCPDRELKQEATDVLRSMEGRVECVWDAKTIAEAGERVLAMMPGTQSHP